MNFNLFFAKIRNIAEKYENSANKGNKRTGKRSHQYSVQLISNSVKNPFLKNLQKLSLLEKLGTK
jgi:hypothetical protein